MYNLPRGQIRVSDISFKVQAKRLWEWIQFIRSYLSRFSAIRQLPGTIQLERLNEGCGIEAAMFTNNALYHQVCKLKYNNTKLQRAEKRTFVTEGEINDTPGACKRTRFHSRSSSTEEAKEVQCFFCRQPAGTDGVHEVATFQFKWTVKLETG